MKVSQDKSVTCDIITIWCSPCKTQDLEKTYKRHCVHFNEDWKTDQSRCVTKLLVILEEECGWSQSQGSPLPNYQLNSSGVRSVGESVTVEKRRDTNTSLGLCMNVQGREEEKGGIVNCVVIVINCDLITLSVSGLSVKVSKPYLDTVSVTKLFILQNWKVSLIPFCA